MSLWSRLKGSLQGNVNEFMNKSEDPEKMLNHFIEGVREQVHSFHVEVNRLEAERLSIIDHIKTCEALIRDWHAKAKLALSQSREDLARQALEEEHREQRRGQQLQTELHEAEQTVKHLQEQHRQLEQKLSEAKDIRDRLVSRNQRAIAQKQALEAVGALHTDLPLSKFERLEEVVQHNEAGALAAEAIRQSSLEYPFDQLKQMKSDDEVDEAFEKLKAECDSESE